MTSIIRASAYRRTRWKNGGGETMEIAVSPEGASLDRFDWRISMATVASDGPFSVFAGVDRTLCILDGAGIQLHVNDEPARQLDNTSEPFSFSGDVAEHSTLVDGTVTDFNVMTRRDRCRHRVQRISLQAGDERVVDPGVRAIFCESGIVSVETHEAGGQLGPRDTALRDASGGAISRLRADVATTVCLVTISELSSNQR